MKKIISMVLSLILIATFMLPLYVSAEETTQSNITTNFDEKTGTLTVSGNGKAYDVFGRNSVDVDFGGLNEQAYKNINKTVKHLIIGEGITEIYNCFNDMYALKDVSFPGTLEIIEFCFLDCDSIKKVTLPKSLEKIRFFSFYDCDALTKIKFSGPVNIGDEREHHLASHVFSNLDSLECVIIPGGSTLGHVFQNCQNLKKVVLGKNISYKTASFDLFDSEAIYYAFNNCHEKLVVYAPDEETYSLCEYENWKCFYYGSLFNVLCPIVGLVIIVVCVIITVLVLKRRKKKKE